MSRIHKLALCFVILAATLLSVSFLQAEPKNAAPIPTQISAAKKVFISNAGQDGLDGFSGEPERTYNQFYSAMKSWGQYELVSSPADADLVFEIRFDVQAVGINVVKGDSVGNGYAPRFQLRILDPKTHFTLWALTQHIAWARFASNRDKDFDHGVADLVSGVKKLAAQSTLSADASGK